MQVIYIFYTGKVQIPLFENPPNHSGMKRFIPAILFLFVVFAQVQAQRICEEVTLEKTTYRHIENSWVPVQFLDNNYPCYQGDTHDVENWNRYMLKVRAYFKETGLFPAMPMYGDYFENLKNWQESVQAWFEQYDFYPQPVYTLNNQRDTEMFTRWKEQWLLHYPVRAQAILSEDSMNLLITSGPLSDAADCELSTPLFGIKANGADECSGAVSLTVGATCTYSGDYTNLSATKSTGMTDPGCLFTSGTAKDIWFTFSMPSSGSATVQTQAGTAPAMSDGSIGYYTGNCGSLVYKACDDDSGPGSMPQITINEPAGTTIYLRYWGYSSSTGNSQFCVMDACPGFTSPSGVTATLSPTSGSSSTNVTFTATGVTGGSCSGNWEYQFETIAGIVKQAWSTTASYTMNGVARDTAMIVKARCSSCPTATVSSSWMVFDYLTPSANDACASAIPLTVSTYCSGTTKYSKKDETNDVGVPAPGCGGYTGGDVWFTTTIPVSGNLNIDTDSFPNAAPTIIGGNHLTDLGMAVYSGSCGALTLLSCDDDNSNNGANPKIALNGLTPGSTVYIRVWDKNNDQEGTFTICATDGPAVDPGQNCLQAYTICNDATVGGNSEGEGIEELTASNHGCFQFGGEHQSTWYAFSPASTGTIGFVLTPTNGTDDYDFAIWGPFASGSTLSTICPPTANPIRCSWFNGVGTFNCYAGDCNNTGMVAGETETSDDADGLPTGTYKGCVAPITVAAGDVGSVYIMLIDNWSATTSPYTFDWVLGGGCALDCAVLPVIAGGFTATCTDPGTLFSWTTYSETNNDHFTIYRLNEANNREMIAIVQGAGNSNTTLDYAIEIPTDKSLNESYQLTQTDFNGKETPIEYTSSHCSETTLFSIDQAYCDKSTGMVHVVFTTDEIGRYTAELISLSGIILERDDLFISAKGESHYCFEKNQSNEIVYIVRISSSEEKSISTKVTCF